jgi:threonine dehydratase
LELATVVDLKLVEHVREFVSGMALRTPCLPSEWLSALTGAEVWLKCENLQVTGSFKVRGPLARLPWLSKDERLCGVLCASAGNHGKGLAWAAKHYGVRCTVCVPRTIPGNKESAIRRYGAKVVKTDFDGFDETAEYARDLAGKTGGVWISPFDDDHIMAGNGGTTALEVFEDLPRLDAIVVPCGGGGIASGMGAVAREKSPRTRILGVNTDASPAMWLSRRDRKPYLRVDSRPTIAEGLEGGVTARSYEIGLRLIDDLLLVQEATLPRAIAELLKRHRMAVEGSSAAGIAALMEGKLPRDAKRVCVVLTGSNIDASRLKEIANAHL